MAFHRRIQKQGNRQNGQSSADPDLSVFGYSSKLHEPSLAIDGGGAGDEDKYLIPWNGDEQLKIDRYDARLYLSSLDEFNEWKGKTTKQNEEESAEDLAEKLEEELCEEQRYMDFYAALKNDEINEEKKKKAEISFNYEQMESKIEENEEKEEKGIDPADDDEPFEKPESLKLPVGIVTPDTMRQNALIERTAAFVVSKGPQMEVVIKAKQRQRADQFDFLDFDHRLHPYYKYLCKLIREKKYTPNLNATPSSRIVKNKKVDVQNESEEDDSDNDGDGDDDGYLHPLLRGGGEKTTENVGGFIGPVKKPPTIQKKSEIMETLMNNSLIHGNLPNTNESSLYSSLMKGLHALLPKKEETKTLSIEDEKRQSSKPTKSNNNNEEIQLETDIERINDYNKWHLEFYGRPSPYLPGPPPIPLPPLPDSAVESGITVAAKYVALHGANAEQRLIEHNGDKVHFLLARSPYYTFYQSSVRNLQWKLFQQSQKMQQQVSQPAIIPPISLLEQISPLPTISQQMNSITGNVPIEIKINECGRNEEEMASSNLIDKKQQERKEKARLFMERILNERLAEKYKKGTMKHAEVEEESSEIIGNDQNELMKKKTKRRSGFDDKFGELASTSAAGTSSGNLTPSQLSKTISSLIDQQLQKTFASKETTPPSNSSSSLKKRKREKKHRKLDTSDESDYSADSRREKAHRKRSKRAKTKKDEMDGAEKKSKHRRKSSIDRRRRKRKSDRRSSHSSSDSKSSTE